MSDLRISKTAWFTALVQDNSAQILNYIDGDPGCTNEAIATGTGINVNIIDEVVDILEADQVLVATYDENGTEVFYTGEDWINALKSNINNARQWVDDLTGNSGTASQMASDLSIPHEIAIALAWQMDHENHCKVTYITG